LSTGARFKEYYLSFVSTLAVLYALLMAFLALGQVAGAGNSLAHLSRYSQVPIWTHRYSFPTIFAIFMFVLAYHLWFKKRTALLVLVAFMAVKAAFDITGGIHAGAAIVSAIDAVFLLTAWGAFVVTPDPFYIRRCIGVAIITVPALALYGVVGLYLGRREYLVSTAVPSLIKNTWLMIVGRNDIPFVGRDLVFKWSLIIVALLVFAYLLFLLFRPHRPPSEYTWEDEETARALLEDFGSDSFAYFNTRKGKSYFFLSDRCFLAYQVVGGMAVISADPIGPEDLFYQLLTDFKVYCARMGWRMAGVGQTDRTSELFRHLGLNVFKLGEEAIIDVTRFTLEGREMRKLRQSVNHIERGGIGVEFMFNAGIPAHVRHELQEISRTWRGDNPEAGYSMGLGRLLSVSDPDCLLSLANDDDSKPTGFQYWVPMYPHLGYSLDVTRTKLTAPRPLSDYLIAKTALFLKDEGYKSLSLHFLALAQYYRTGSAEKKSKLWGKLAVVIDRWFPVVSAYAFDRKFSPDYISRYMIYPSHLEFLRAALTVVVAESALKLTGRAERKSREQAARTEEALQDKRKQAAPVNKCDHGSF